MIHPSQQTTGKDVKHTIVNNNSTEEDSDQVGCNNCNQHNNMIDDKRTTVVVDTDDNDCHNEKAIITTTIQEVVDRYSFGGQQENDDVQQIQQCIQQTLGDFGVTLFCPLLQYEPIIKQQQQQQGHHHDSMNSRNRNINDITTISCITDNKLYSPSCKNNNNNNKHMRGSINHQQQQQQETYDTQQPTNTKESFFGSSKPSFGSSASGITEDETDSENEYEQYRNNNNNHDQMMGDCDHDADDDYDWYHPISVRCEPTHELLECPRILTIEMMTKLRDEGLPKTLQQYEWDRCFCIGLHGDSFTTLLNQCVPYKYTFIVIRTTANEILGGFASERWQPQNNNHNTSTSRSSGSSSSSYGSSSNIYGSSSSTYYGNGLSFLFVVNDDNNHHHQTLIDRDDSDETTKICNRNKKQDKQQKMDHHHHNNHNNSVVTIYPWTGDNDYCQICDVPNRLLCMGGVGDFGLVVRNCLSTGITGSSATYGNPPLIKSSTRSSSSSSMLESIFEIADFEIYGLKPLYSQKEFLM